MSANWGFTEVGCSCVHSVVVLARLPQRAPGVPPRIGSSENEVPIPLAVLNLPLAVGCTLYDVQLRMLDYSSNCKEEPHQRWAVDRGRWCPMVIENIQRCPAADIACPGFTLRP